MEKLLEVEHLTKVFSLGSMISRIRITATDNVSFYVKPAEIFCLAGESGCGKTTVARMILGFEEPTSGAVVHKGKRGGESKGRKVWFTEGVQAIFQDPFGTFNPLRRVDRYFFETIQNFRLAGNNGEAIRLIEEKLSAVGLSYEEFSGKYPSEFSGGQLQRISIARALLTNPTLLVADEPVSMVDASLRMSIVNLFKTLKEEFGLSVLYITHDLATAYYVSDRIAIMFRGNIVEMGPVERVLMDPKHPYTRLLRESIPEADPKKRWNKTVTLSDFEHEEYLREGCRFAGRCPDVMEKCKSQVPEDLYVDDVLVKCHKYTGKYPREGRKTIVTIMNPNHTSIYKNSASPKERVDDLVSQMTLEEKISQMVHDAPAIERLGVPAYNWWNECLHGVGRAGVATVFPQAIGLAATWNPDLMHQVATAISDEARAKHHEAARRGIREIYTGLTFWSPNINIFRDPRWGRGQETYGEDPYLTASMGVSFVKGLQGDNPHYLKLVATPKHFAVHSGPELDRHHFDAQVSERDLRETYLPAFEACVREAKAVSVMGAYNRTNGEPCCASATLLEKILRQEWGFDGYVVSDCWAIYDIYAHHEVVDTPEEAAALAVENGCELNCGEVYPALLEAVEQGLISEDIINRAVKRLFTARFRLGMFDPPEQVLYTQTPYEIVDSPEHRALALQAARESIVLLKNEDNLLPLRKTIESVAVIGPNADDLQVLLGNYNGTPVKATTPLEGIRKKIAPSARLYYAQGCAIADGVPPLKVIPSTYLRPTNAEANEKGLTAAYYGNPKFEDEPVLSQVDRVVDFIWKDTTPLTGQWGDHFAVRWTGFLVPPKSGTYKLGVNGFSAYSLYLDGELIAQYKGIHHPILQTKEIELEAGRLYDIQLDYVSQGLDPQVKLVWSVPDTEYISSAVEVAQKAEVVVVVMGLSPALEGEEMPVHVEGFAGGDRTDIKLPRPQEELLKQIHALGKPTVLVLLNGSALAVNWAAEHVPAIVEAWYPGQAGGEALADVLFGDYNPAGRLPVTFYKSVEDLPPFEDYQVESRTYRYFQGEPLFPFGYGLSYARFEFDNLHVDRSEVKVGGKVAVSVDVTNTSDCAGDEVVQLYVRHRDATVPRPIKGLKGFKRITLQPGERKTVTFTLYTNQLGFYDEVMRYGIQPGTVEVMVGNSSQHLPLTGAFEVVGQPADVSSDKIFFSDVKAE